MLRHHARVLLPFLPAFKELRGCHLRRLGRDVGQQFAHYVAKHADRLAYVGTSGSGKTYNAGTSVERLLHGGARAVISDPLGVWWGLRMLADGKAASRFKVVIFASPSVANLLTVTSTNTAGLVGVTQFSSV